MAVSVIIIITLINGTGVQERHSGQHFPELCPTMHVESIVPPLTAVNHPSDGSEGSRTVNDSLGLSLSQFSTQVTKACY